MRNGAHWPSSGASTMVGKSCDRVCVRSTTRISPEATARANDKTSTVIRVALGSLIFARTLARHFALERLRIDGKPRADVIGDIADKHILKTALQTADHCVGKRRRRKLRRRHGLKPFGFERAEEHVHHFATAGGLHGAADRQAASAAE